MLCFTITNQLVWTRTRTRSVGRVGRPAPPSLPLVFVSRHPARASPPPLFPFSFGFSSPLPPPRPLCVRARAPPGRQIPLPIPQLHVLHPHLHWLAVAAALTTTPHPSPATGLLLLAPPPTIFYTTPSPLPPGRDIGAPITTAYPHRLSGGREGDDKALPSAACRPRRATSTHARGRRSRGGGASELGCFDSVNYRPAGTRGGCRKDQPQWRGTGGRGPPQRRRRFCSSSPASRRRRRCSSTRARGSQSQVRAPPARPLYFPSSSSWVLNSLADGGGRARADSDLPAPPPPNCNAAAAAAWFGRNWLRSAGSPPRDEEAACELRSTRPPDSSRFDSDPGFVLAATAFRRSFPFLSPTPADTRLRLALASTAAHAAGNQQPLFSSLLGSINRGGCL